MSKAPALPNQKKSRTKKARVAPDGEVYLVKDGQGEGLCAKFLNDPTAQREVEASLQGSGLGALADTPLDIAFSRGKFVGYIYQDFDAWNQAPEAGGNTGLPGLSGHVQSQGHGGGEPGYMGGGSGFVGGSSGYTGAGAGGQSGGADNPLVRWGILLLGALGLVLLNVKLFHRVFLNFVEGMFSPEVLAGCEVLGFSGMTAAVLGLVAAGLLYRYVSGADTPVFLAVELGSLLGGILLTDVLIVAVIQLVMGVVSLLIAVVPIIVVVAVLIALVKGIFKR